MRVHLLPIVLLILIVQPVWSQEFADDTFALPRIDGDIQLDGLSNEAAWETVEPLPMVMYQPVYMGAPTEETEVRIGYDDDYLYVSGRFYDSEPSGIRSNSLYRDVFSGDDLFSVMLDTFNDNENGLWFFTNPAGVRLDWAINNDAEGGGSSRPFNDSWNTFWDVETVINDDGWFAEMRIPFSSLGFQDEAGRATMGVTIYRYISRKNERHIFPAVSPEFNMGFAKPSTAEDVTLDNVQSQKPFYITPYLIGGIGQTSELNSTETKYVLQDDVTQDFGLDLKYNLTSNLTLDVTANTDFAQVEADDQQVNLTRFSLFFPEKRQFFQQRAGIFDFNTGGQTRLFYSRRVGLNDGELTRIYGGTRLVGRIGDWDIGLLDMQTASIADVPSENFGVIRLRRRVLNENSYAGGLFTSRVGNDGTYNFAYGIDGIFRVIGSDYLTVKWAQTFEDDIIDASGFDPWAASLVFVEWERRGQQGLSYASSITRSGADYEPGVGFATRQDFTQIGARLAYGHFPDEASSLRRVAPFSFGRVSMRNVDGTVESAFFGAPWNLEYKSGARLFLGNRVWYEDLTDVLEFPEDTQIPRGSYWFYGIDARYSMARSRLLRASSDFNLQTFYDGWRFDFGFEPTWNVSLHLELSTEYSVNLVRFPDRDQGFDAHIVRFRAQTALNTQVSLSTFLQYSNIADLVTANLRFRYNFREGNDLWIVYNEGLHTHRSGSDLARPLTDSRTILLKYTYTFDV